MERLSFVGGEGHQTYSDFADRVNEETFSWAFVRNPYDRIWSTFHAAKQHGGVKRPNLKDSFLEMLRDIADGVPVVLPHQRPQVDFICDDDRNILVDFVGRFEHIEHDWCSVLQILIMGFVELPHENKSEHGDWIDYFSESPESTLLVEQIYADDFETFGYPTIKH